MSERRVKGHTSPLVKKIQKNTSIGNSYCLYCSQLTAIIIFFFRMSKFSQNTQSLKKSSCNRDSKALKTREGTKSYSQISLFCVPHKILIQARVKPNYRSTAPR